MTIEIATLAGGCFWGMQDLFRKRTGVISTRVGYTGGDVSNATYPNHGRHAEGIEVTFDNQACHYRDILAFFFQVHNPCTKDQQGNDKGTSYRSAIYFHSKEQEQIAKKTLEEVNQSGLWPSPTVTELDAATEFWPAEPEHQDYLERNPHGYTCHFIRKDWVLPK